MGSVVKGLTGGSESSGNSQSGFALLPKELQDAFKQYGTQITDLFASPQSQAFTPMGMTGEETAAFDRIRQGLGSAGNFANNVAMQMNPFDQYVVNDINRQAQGANSLVNQAASRAGQMGSNRNFLATSDVEQNRLNQIGQLRQGQYNQAVQNALGPLASLQQQDIQNLLGVGGFQRGLQQQTQQAPFNALQFYGGLLGALPQSGGSTSNQSSSSSNGIGGILQGAGAVASMFSDKRLKDDVTYIGQDNGHHMYKFKYKGDNKYYIGVMAQDVLKSNPDAVKEIEGYLTVDYDKIGVQMIEA